MAKYTGAITTTGKSEAIRLDKPFFRQHPEFKQKAKVQAHVIAPGVALVSVINESPSEEEEDPVLNAFLAFLAQDMASYPERIIPLSEDLMAQAEALTVGIEVSDDEIIPDDITL